MKLVFLDKCNCTRFTLKMYSKFPTVTMNNMLALTRHEGFCT